MNWGLAKSVDTSDALRMKPIAFAFRHRILLLAGDPTQLEGVEVSKNPNSNLVLVKKNLDA